MYLPAHFEERRPEVLQELMRRRPLALLVTAGADGPVADLLPLLAGSGPGAARLTLRGHVARANPLWQRHDPVLPVLAVFQGPQHYVSPSWYPTKREHGKVVPTWNYCMVQARGRLRTHEDPAWLRGLVGELTRTRESALPQPWSIEDAPADYLETMLRAIVGIEIEVTEITGKWKVSQNQPAANREGVVAALEAMGGAAGEVAAQVRLPGTP